MPDRLPEGAKVARRKVDSLLASLGYREQEYVQAVVSCPKYWPEPNLGRAEDEGRRSVRRHTEKQTAQKSQWFMFVDDE